MMRAVALHVLDKGPMITAAICTLVCGHERHVVLENAASRKKRKPVPTKMKCPICTLALGR